MLEGVSRRGPPEYAGREGCAGWAGRLRGAPHGHFTAGKAGGGGGGTLSLAGRKKRIMPSHHKQAASCKVAEKRVCLHLTKRPQGLA